MSAFAHLGDKSAWDWIELVAAMLCGFAIIRACLGEISRLRQARRKPRSAP